MTHLSPNCCRRFAHLRSRALPSLFTGSMGCISTFSREVIIVDTFTRRGLPLADVAKLCPRGFETWVMGRVETCRQDRMTHVGLGCASK